MKRGWNRWVGIAIVCFLGGGSLRAQSGPVVLEAYGDSITAGFMSGTSLTQAPPLVGATRDATSISRFMTDFACFAANRDRTCLTRDHWPEHAWPVRLAPRLSERLGQTFEVHNEAVSMARVVDLLGQVAGAPESRGETWAFFYIGYNDLEETSALTSQELAKHYRNRYRAALEEWDRRHENSKVYLLPLLDINRVFAALHGYVWRPGPRPFTCETSWTIFPYGSRHAAEFRKGDLEEFSAPRVEGMNAALETLATELGKHSQHGNQAEVLHGLYSWKLVADDFAVDCYHLSSHGQAGFAGAVEKALLSAGAER